MCQGTAIVKRAFLLASFVLMTLPGVALAQPVLNTFSFTPTSINTASAPAEVTVSFTATDATSSVFYFEVAFVHPATGLTQSGSKLTFPSVTGPVTVTFPAFSSSGTWKVLGVFLADVDGNTLLLDTTAIGSAFGVGLGSTDLEVTSAVDSTPPNVSSFTYTPTINTTSAAQPVTVNITATDNLAGVTSVYVGFVSPSGQTTNGTRVTAPADFTAGTTVTNPPLSINFPKLSEPGTWKVSFINVVDGAGNTLLLNTADVAGRGYSTDLIVTSTPDTTKPNLTFAPGTTTIGSTGGNAIVNFTATDDLSGVNAFQVSFQSPSGGVSLGGGTSFPPGTLNTGPSSAVVAFPASSEPGTWTASVFLSDVSGNARLCPTDVGFCPTLPTLTVTAAPVDNTPPVILVSVNPLPNGAGWNNTDVMLMWTVTDPESPSGITTMNCGPTTETTSVVRTCTATSPGGTNEVSVVIKIDKTAPVTSTPVATPSPKPAISQKTITGAANNGSGLIRITATGHGFATGNYVTITGVTGTTEANGLFPITVITADTFDLVGSAFVDAYLSGGLASVPLVISATVTDGGSGVASAEYNIDGGAFDDLDATDGSFGGPSENVRVALAITHPVLIAGGNHTFCVRGADAAENVGAAACVTVNITPHTPPPVEQFGFFVGLRNSDDQGTNFDLRVEVLKNSLVVATGLTRCVEDVTRNPNLAKEVSVVLPALTGVNTGEVLSFRISTRIGTNPDDTKCDGHNNATGLRLYYDATVRPSLVQAEINGAPLANFFLHRTGTSDFFDTTAPTDTTAKEKDSASVNFNGGNLFKEIGTWSRTQP